MAAARHGVSLFAGIGPELVRFALDVEAARLERRGALTLPARVQYAWPHARRPILYVGCAARTPSGEGEHYSLCAVGYDGEAMRLRQEPVPLAGRPIHLSTDASSRHVLVAYAKGAPGLTVHRIRAHGRIGDERPHDDSFRFGAFPHQVRTLPYSARAVLVTRGMKGFGGPDYVPGELMVARFDRGRVETLYAISPDARSAPQGFNPRDLDFHPTEPLMFVSLEGQHQLCVFRQRGVDIAPEPLFVRNTLADPQTVRPRQDAGAVHVHPNGRFVYVANRNDGYVGGYGGPSWIKPDPVPVFPGGENSIAVFRLDPATGEPTLIQTVGSGGLHPRTFALDPSGRVLLVGHVTATRIREGDAVVEVPANVTLFRVGEDGRLTHAGRLDLETGDEKCWWTGLG
jgi:6-phosphogluconolactonase (cycloisomerase 2 family)